MLTILLIVTLLCPDKEVTLTFGRYHSEADCQRELRRTELQLPQILSIARLKSVTCVTAERGT